MGEGGVDIKQIEDNYARMPGDELHAYIWILTGIFRCAFFGDRTSRFKHILSNINSETQTIDKSDQAKDQKLL